MTESGKEHDEFEGMSAAGRAAMLRARARRNAASPPRCADFRAEAEDDDGYDPYSDYMDALNRSECEEPSADPWR